MCWVISAVSAAVVALGSSMGGSPIVATRRTDWSVESDCPTDTAVESTKMSTNINLSIDYPPRIPDSWLRLRIALSSFLGSPLGTCTRGLGERMGLFDVSGKAS